MFKNSISQVVNIALIIILAEYREVAEKHCSVQCGDGVLRSVVIYCNGSTVSDFKCLKKTEQTTEHCTGTSCPKGKFLRIFCI